MILGLRDESKSWWRKVQVRGIAIFADALPCSRRGDEIEEDSQYLNLSRRVSESRRFDPTLVWLDVFTSPSARFKQNMQSSGSPYSGALKESNFVYSS